MNKISFWNEIKVSVIAALVLLLLVSGVYPLVVWGISQVAFHNKANGSLITDSQGTVIGSSLLAQGFTADKYFHPRPSAAGAGYDAANSSGSNLGPASQKLIDSIRERVAAYRHENGLDSAVLIPGDAVTASASGLDPEISLDNALLQTKRVAAARGMEPAEVEKRVRESLRKRDLGVLGEPGVNVLLLNLSLDRVR